MFRLRSVVPFVLASGLALAAQAPKPVASRPNPKFSHARIVRVSLAQGAVAINQQDGRGWQRLSVNAPISEADQVRTGPGARAIIELEAGSTVKLIPNSEATFQQLALTPKGERLSDVAVTAGTVYVTLESKDASGFRALFPEGVVTSSGHGAEFRVAVAQGTGAVRVLKGRAEVATAGDSYLLGKNDVLQLAETAPADLAKNKTRDTWDQWDTQVDAQDRGNLKAQMAGYGNWQGNWWYPAGMGLGWNPYSNGTWFFDPTLGYMWDSMYPWGWAPFHYGMWWDSPLGWCWSPLGGEYFMGGPQLFMNGGLIATSLAPPVPPAPPTHPRTTIAGIAAIHSGGAVAPARLLGTRAWYRARALGELRVARGGAAGPAARRAPMGMRLSAGQVAAQRRARATFGHDREQVLGPRMMRLPPEEAEPGMAAMPGSSMAPPGAARAATAGMPMRTASPVSHVGGGARVIPK